MVDRDVAEIADVPDLAGHAVGGAAAAAAPCDSANFSGRIATQTVSPATSAVAAVGDDVAAGLRPSAPGPGRARPRPRAPRARSRRPGSRRRSGWSGTRTSRRRCRSAPTRPSFMIAIRVETVIASSWSWVTMTKVRPRLSWMLTSSNCVRSRSFLSRAPRGSSSSSTLGRLMIARASATRCFCPPESWSGRRFSRPSSCTSSHRLGDPVA